MEGPPFAERKASWMMWRFLPFFRPQLACVAGVLRGRKEERRAREARGDGTREDHVRGVCKDAIVFFIPPSN